MYAKKGWKQTLEKKKKKLLGGRCDFIVNSKTGYVPFPYTTRISVQQYNYRNF